MVLIDWIIVGLYIASAIFIGVLFTKKASESTTDFFVAGRSLPWFIAGTSIVATTFSADTPLFVSGMSRSSGISSNWFWWSAAIGQIASVFFFAKLWRRTEVVTDIEFLVKRYEKGPVTSFLRGFKVLYDGILVNCVVIASVTLAMAKIIKVMLNLSEQPFCTIPFLGDITPTSLLLVILGGSAVIYSAMSGLYGVVYTDLIQFTLAMLGSIALAVIVYVDASGGEGMLAKLHASPDFKPLVLKFFPDFGSFNLLTFTFFIYIFVAWWSMAPGNGYTVQRLLSTRSEKDSVLAFLWFNICHYIIRPWPWIIVGVLSIIYFPNLDDPENCFPLMIHKFMPAGLKGVIVASLLAAFMSTIDTQLNWGASYMVNDFYRPYMVKNANPKHYVKVSRICMVLITLVAFLVSTKLTSILSAYKYLVVMTGGLGTVMIARWYWWRVNPFSEIAAIISSLVVGNLVAIFLASTPERDLFAVRLLINIGVTTIAWVIVTLLTTKEPGPQTKAFYSKMKISGPGWKYIKDITGVEPIKGELARNFVCWISSTVLLLSLLMCIGKLLFHEWAQAGIYIAICVAAGLVLKSRIKNFLKA